MTIVISPYTPALRRALCELWYDSFSSAGLSHDPKTDVAALMLRLDEEIANGWQVLVARDGPALMGFLAYDPSRAYLNQLFLARAAQRQGLGKRFLDIAKARMPGGFRLRTHEANTGAQRFYEREGMTLDLAERHPRYGHMTFIYKWP